MAFDRPLEADKVDDLGLFSAFLRAPVVGTLMWVLGGSKAMEEEQREKERLDVANGEERVSVVDASLKRQSNRFKAADGKMKKTAPRLMGSDISEFGECATELEALALSRSSSENLRGFAAVKKMSWSDESGQSLVEIIDESATPYEPTTLVTPAVPGTKPIKSAMRRTSSVSGDAYGLAQDASATRYLPKGLGAGHSGLVIPTKPGDVSMTAGYHSPEWGWYINTTPPTPEMYHNQYSSTRPKKSSLKDSTRKSVALHPSQTAVQTSGPPPTFSSKAHVRATNMGWPSVPL